MSECRFKFSGSYCAHKEIQGERCKGHDDCHHFSPPYLELPARIGPTLQDGCEHRKFGVYCAKVQKFVCEGPDSCDF